MKKNIITLVLLLLFCNSCIFCMNKKEKKFYCNAIFSQRVNPEEQIIELPNGDFPKSIKTFPKEDPIILMINIETIFENDKWQELKQKVEALKKMGFKTEKHYVLKSNSTTKTSELLIKPPKNIMVSKACWKSFEKNVLDLVKENPNIKIALVIKGKYGVGSSEETVLSLVCAQRSNIISRLINCHKDIKPLIVEINLPLQLDFQYCPEIYINKDCFRLDNVLKNFPNLETLRCTPVWIDINQKLPPHENLERLTLWYETKKHNKLELWSKIYNEIRSFLKEAYLYEV